MIIDSHCHLDHEPLLSDLDNVIKFVSECDILQCKAYIANKFKAYILKFPGIENVTRASPGFINIRLVTDPPLASTFDTNPPHPISRSSGCAVIIRKLLLKIIF